MNINVRYICSLKKSALILLVCFLLFRNISIALEEETNYKPFTANVHVNNMFIVESAALFATSLEYNAENKKFTLGLWGGASFNGRYKEFSHYAQYRFNNNLFSEALSCNNYTSMERPEMFSCDKTKSPDFVDLSMIYTIPGKVPLSIYWDTILAGQAGDYTEDDNGKITDFYSIYVDSKYRAWEKGSSKLSVFAGGAFSLTTKKTFYCEKPIFVHLGVLLNQNAKLFSKDIPIKFITFLES